METIMWAPFVCGAIAAILGAFLGNESSSANGRMTGAFKWGFLTFMAVALIILIPRGCGA